MIVRYEDLFLTVHGSSGHYVVEARGPGIPLCSDQSPYRETDEIRAVVMQLVGGESPTYSSLCAVGQLLFEALFPPKIYQAFSRIPLLLAPGTLLRLKLILYPPELNL